ncbi:MAG: hypothetical protein AAFY27_11050 [Pseudomonadota bacterium]
MRISAVIIFSCFIASAPAQAADPVDIFGSILGEIERHIERRQHIPEPERLAPLLRACMGGNLAECDRAVRLPNLSRAAREEIARIRAEVVARAAFERNFRDCQKSDRMACKSALAYPDLKQVDRNRLETWLQTAQENIEDRRAFWADQEQCVSGSIAACDRALANPQAVASYVAGIKRQRQRHIAARRAS